MHYDAITENLKISKVESDSLSPNKKEITVTVTPCAQACAKITEIEKLKAEKDAIWEIKDRIKQEGESQLYDILQGTLNGYNEFLKIKGK